MLKTEIMTLSAWSQSQRFPMRNSLDGTLLNLAR